MNLFNKEKDLILKVTNLVLLLWLITSIVILYTNIVDIVMKQPLMTLDEYKSIECEYRKILDDTNQTKDCEELYNVYKKNNETNIYYKQKIILTSLGSIIIVGATLYSLNKKKKRGVN